MHIDWKLATKESLDFVYTLYERKALLCKKSICMKNMRSEVCFIIFKQKTKGKYKTNEGKINHIINGYNRIQCIILFLFAIFFKYFL